MCEDVLFTGFRGQHKRKNDIVYAIKTTNNRKINEIRAGKWLVKLIFRAKKGGEQTIFNFLKNRMLPVIWKPHHNIATINYFKNDARLGCYLERKQILLSHSIDLIRPNGKKHKKPQLM